MTPLVAQVSGAPPGGGAGGGSGAAIHPVVVLPICALAMLLIAAHLLALRHAAMPPSRKRIRQANAGVMLALAPILAFSFASASPSSPRSFLLSWSVSVWLIGLVLVLASLDVANSLRLHRHALRALRRSANSRADRDPPRA